ncbi:MAG: ATPase [Candidatus Saccharibacteria bacterium]|nr:ATPase [Candidatus Saccharibacteria bacterium]
MAEKMIARTITPLIRSRLGRGRVIVLYGPRRVGKTTVARQILSEAPAEDQLYLNCDEMITADALKPISIAALERVIGQAKRIVIDEAQRVENIGLTLKLLIDTHPELDIIATGSSSFDLAGKVKEPLTGRAYEFFLTPLSLSEIKSYFGYTDLQIPTLFDRLLRLGSYPGIILTDDNRADEEIISLAQNYVYKDSLELVELRQRQLLPRLLQALALNIGKETSYNELAVTFGVKVETIERYITLLEMAFVVYRLPALTGSERGALSNRKRKVYFYDLGIRNALIQSLQPLDLRADRDVLWENFCMNERMKYWQAKDQRVQRYYWRALSNELDLVEATNDRYSAYDFAYTDKKLTTPKYFSDTYPDNEARLIHTGNLLDWLS